MKKLWIYSLVFIILPACVKKADWAEPGDGMEYIVVDGILTNESRIQHLYIYYNKSNLNDTPDPVIGAEVIISNEDETYQLDESPDEAGLYITDSIVVAGADRNYSLLIFHQGSVYSAQAYMIPGKTFPELIYKKNDDNELYHIDYVASSFEASDQAMWEILIDWSSVPGYEHKDPEACRKKLLFYTLSTLDVSQIFAPVVEQVSFPAGTIIDQRRYSLTNEHADFIRSLLLETSWQGGVFPSDPANANTNLSDGAIGFFGVCAVNSLSLTVTTQKKQN